MQIQLLKVAEFANAVRQIPHPTFTHIQMPQAGQAAEGACQAACIIAMPRIARAQSQPPQFPEVAKAARQG